MAGRKVGPKMGKRRHGRVQKLSKKESKERFEETLDQAHHLVKIVAKVKPQYTHNEKGCIVRMHLDKCKWDPIFWGRSGVIEFKEVRGKLLKQNYEHIMRDIRQNALSLSRYCSEQMYKDYHAKKQGIIKEFDE